MNRQSFARDVKALTCVKGEMGNPFCDDNKDILVLDSRDLADPAVINTLCQIDKLGQEQYDAYVNEQLVNQTKPITDPIKRQKTPSLQLTSSQREAKNTAAGVVPQE